MLGCGLAELNLTDKECMAPNTGRKMQLMRFLISESACLRWTLHHE